MLHPKSCATLPLRAVKAIMHRSTTSQTRIGPECLLLALNVVDSCKRRGGAVFRSVRVLSSGGMRRKCKALEEYTCVDIACSVLHSSFLNIV